ncbi:unnamed protein product [Cuscuta campestris]|uniref:Reverse transcriptase Ty1/copia-type domain-containing protein n=1 Tax=Cuscuta campestris TaxID=132261 RepID=A0A484KI91_9ASTE|nr:unnamed protein product [Cuscuta campestris]
MPELCLCGPDTIAIDRALIVTAWSHLKPCHCFPDITTGKGLPSESAGSPKQREREVAGGDCLRRSLEVNRRSTAAVESLEFADGSSCYLSHLGRRWKGPSDRWRCCSPEKKMQRRKRNCLPLRRCPARSKKRGGTGVRRVSIGEGGCESTATNRDIILKLDMAKAYDRVSWYFMNKIQRQLWCSDKWIVFRLLSNNCLFIIGAELISQMLNLRIQQQASCLFSQSKGIPPLNHLAFADDMIIFTSGKDLDGLGCYRESMMAQLAFSGTIGLESLLSPNAIVALIPMWKVWSMFFVRGNLLISPKPKYMAYLEVGVQVLSWGLAYGFRSIIIETDEGELPSLQLGINPEQDTYLSTTYLFLYVDDIVLTVSSSSLFESLIQKLKAEFAMTDMGDLHFFLSINVHRTSNGLFLHQTQFTHDILERDRMVSCRPISTTVDTKAKLSSSSGMALSDPSLYKSIVGALQYLTFTQPDITYTVQQLCLHLHTPCDHSCHPTDDNEYGDDLCPNHHGRIKWHDPNHVNPYSYANDNNVPRLNNNAWGAFTPYPSSLAQFAADPANAQALQGYQQVMAMMQQAGGFMPFSYPGMMPPIMSPMAPPVLTPSTFVHRMVPIHPVNLTGTMNEVAPSNVHEVDEVEQEAARRRKGKAIAKPSKTRDSAFKRLGDKEDGPCKSSKLRFGPEMGRTSAMERLGGSRHAQSRRSREYKTIHLDEEEAESQPRASTYTRLSYDEDDLDKMGSIARKLRALEERVEEKAGAKKHTLAKSPFSARVHAQNLRRKVKLDVEKFTGKEDPNVHLDTFHNAAQMAGLPHGKIGSFEKLAEIFRKKYEENCVKRKKFTYLNTVGQREKESLTQFLTRWRDEIDKVEDMDDKTAMSLLMNAFRSGDLYTEFCRRPPSSYQEAYNTAWEYAEAEVLNKRKRELEEGYMKVKTEKPKKDDHMGGSWPRTTYDGTAHQIRNEKKGE